jgi:hypothetical protein
MQKLLIRANEDGEIVTWGEDFAGGTEIPSADIPADWTQFNAAKYIWNGTALVVREGWVDPEPEA